MTAVNSSDRERVLIGAARRAAESLESTFSSAFPSVSIAGYDLMREIHRGGQGVVFEAIQQSTRRNVAIKILHERFQSGSAGHVRFQREGQILAQLRHPNIVVVHDTGSIDGAPYLVMDCVEGEPLDDYLQQAKLDVPAIMRLFLSVCEAVSAAHQRGVIHRDIKPSNVRVRGDGSPCLLDFGLARPESGRDAANEITKTDHFVGSLPWASPEQVSSTGDRLDVRSDVYSLGLLLYFMLTGKSPYEARGAPRQVIENILIASPTLIRVHRDFVDDDVETIVRKCLAKERERRYQFAGELADDVRHWLKHEPIAAKRDSGLYLLRMFLRRYRWGVLAVVALLVTSSIGFGVSAAQWRRAAFERDRADQTRGFLERMLLSIDPAIAKGRDQTILREMLESADREARTSFEDRPELAASLRMTLGDIRRKLGQFQEAADHYDWARDVFERLNGVGAVQTIDAECSLAQALIEASKFDEAEPLCLSGLAHAEANLAPGHALIIDALSNLSSLRNEQGRLDESETYARDAIARLSQNGHGPSRETAELLMNLAVALHEKAEHAHAIALFKEAHDIYVQISGDETPGALTAEAGIAGATLTSGHYAEAEPLLSAVWRKQQQVMGAEHPDTLDTQHRYGWCLLALQRFADAAPVLDEAWALRKKVLGQDHRDTLATAGGVMIAMQYSGRLEEAIRIGAETLEARRQKMGPEHRDVLVQQTNYALLLLESGDAKTAIELLRRSYEGEKKALPADHPATITTLVNLGRALWMQKEFEEAEPLLREALAACQRKVGTKHPLYRESLDYLSLTLEDRGRFQEAAPLLQELLGILEKSYSADAHEIRVALRRLAFALEQDGAFDDAIALLRRWVSACDSAKDADAMEKLRATAELAFALQSQGESAESDTLFKEVGAACAQADLPASRDLAIALLRLGQGQSRLDSTSAAATLTRAKAMLEEVKADPQWVDIADRSLKQISNEPP